MRYVALFLFSVMFLSPNVVLSETMDDLVEREGLYYKKFTDVPFTGKVTGVEQGSFNNGKKDGPWIGYHKNGQLFDKVDYKNGKQDGPYVGYHKNGQLWEKGDYRNGKKEGLWVRYWATGQFMNKGNHKIMNKGNYKNGKREGPWVSYWDKGQLNYKGSFKNGKKEGPWVNYHPEGTVDKEFTGTYKDGKKISD
jgi:antitoxin component YwqK of YwqJK toxin-antitoxin module